MCAPGFTGLTRACWDRRLHQRHRSAAKWVTYGINPAACKLDLIRILRCRQRFSAPSAQHLDWLRDRRPPSGSSALPAAAVVALVSLTAPNPSLPNQQVPSFVSFFRVRVRWPQRTGRAEVTSVHHRALEKGDRAFNIDPPTSTLGMRRAHPTAERAAGPARMIVKSLTSGPGIREQNR